MPSALVKFRLCAVTIALGVSVAPAAVAAPTKTVCRGDLPFGSYEQVVVPANQTCTAFGSTVSGTFTVKREATLDGGFVTIGGSLIADEAKNVRLTGYVAGGAVIIRGGGGNLAVQASTVGGVLEVAQVTGFVAIINNGAPGALGRVRVVDNQLRPLDATSTVGLNFSSNQVATNATVSGNRGRVENNVQGNTVGGVLACTKNKPPFLGTFNTAATFKGQCSGPE